MKIDPKLPGGKENYKIVKPREFYDFSNSPEWDGRKNDFVLLYSCSEGDNSIFIECDDEEKKLIRSQNHRIDYLKMVHQMKNYREVSIDETIKDTNGASLTDILEDESINVEMEVEMKDQIRRLREALKKLDEKEKYIIDMFYLNDDTVSEREYGRMHGFSHKKAHREKVKALDKLRMYMQ